jgi:hypothetical protein
VAAQTVSGILPTGSSFLESGLPLTRLESACKIYARKMAAQFV